MGEASHRVEGWVRKEFNEMRDSESWVKPVSGEFEGKSAKPYRGPWVVDSQAELFPHGMVATASNGEWVRRQLRAAGVDHITWTAEDMWGKSRNGRKQIGMIWPKNTRRTRKGMLGLTENGVRPSSFDKKTS